MQVLPKQYRVKLHQAQAAFRRDASLYRGYVGGRGAGKTWVGAYDLMARAKPGRTYFVGSPTYTILADTTFPTFEQIAREMGTLVSVKVTPRPNVTITAAHGGESGTAVVRFRSLENPEMARGPNLSGAWLDEASLMPRGAFDIIIASLREKGEMGWLSATFTPKGRTHWTYDIFGKRRPNTAIIHSTTRANPFNADAFADLLATHYQGTFARQELGGEFVDEDDSFAVLPAAWVRAAMERWTAAPPHPLLSSLGVDVAYGGADRTVIAPRYGSWFAPLLKYAGSQTPSGAASAYFVRQAMGQQTGALVSVDGIGYGAACCEALVALRLQVMPVNFGSGAHGCRDRTGCFSFLNVRAFAYWSLREALDPASGMNLALPPDDELEEELTAPRWTAVGGVVRIEPKDEIKKRLGRSPDCADAVALAVLLPGYGGEPLGPIQMTS